MASSLSCFLLFPLSSLSLSPVQHSHLFWMELQGALGDGMNVISSGYSLVTASFFFSISFLNRPACRPFFEETEPDADVYIGPRRLSLYGGGSASRLL
jgi:hypothetical protein